MDTKKNIGFTTETTEDELARYERLVERGRRSVQTAIDLMGEHMSEMSANLELLDGNPGTLADSVLGDSARKITRDSAKIVGGVDDFFVVAEAARIGRVGLSDGTVLSVATYCETLTGMIKSCLSLESTLRERQDAGLFQEAGTEFLNAMSTARGRMFLAIEAVSRMCGPVDEA